MTQDDRRQDERTARWSPARIKELLELQLRLNAGAPETSIGALEKPPTARVARVPELLLDELLARDHAAFVHAAHQTLLGRAPLPDEQDGMLDALVHGEAKSYLLGLLRYGPEGRLRAVTVPGLRRRYLAQRLFHAPIAGPIFAWLNAVVRLPQTVRALRAAHQVAAEAISGLEHAVEEAARSANDISLKARDRGDNMARQLMWLTALHQELADDVQRLKHESAMAAARESPTDDGAEARVPPAHPESLEVVREALIERARDRLAIPHDVPVSSLSDDLRYSLFEAVFYDSAIVARKQRVYLHYLADAARRQEPFADLGCGRGEFLRILREAGIRPIGVDVNPEPLATLRSDGFEAVQQDLLAFLELDPRPLSGASMLQVAEHLQPADLRRALALLAGRLVPGGVLLIETPNPLSPFALGEFHTDPTHVTPIPPERLRFELEAAGFDAPRILFQGPIPPGFRFGPDPRSYYLDYAVIAYQPAT